MNWSIFSKNRNYIYGVSILSIVIFHYCEDVLTAVKSAGVLEGVSYQAGLVQAAQIYNNWIGSIGVEIFLFLSGMGLYFSMKRDSNLLHFYDKRLRRIAASYLIVGGGLWLLADVIMQREGATAFLKDFCFITLFTDGVRTFWYVACILLAYLIYPLVFAWMEKFENRRAGWLCFVLLIAAALLIQYVPKFLIPDVYSKAEILLCRFLIFFIGSYYGQKVYRQEPVKWNDFVLPAVGLVWMTLYRLSKAYAPLEPLGKLTRQISTRNLLCLWSITLLFALAFLLDKLRAKRIQRGLSILGSASFEIYLTHVAVRKIMKSADIHTYQPGNYLICIAVSLVMTYFIIHVTSERKK